MSYLLLIATLLPVTLAVAQIGCAVRENEGAQALENGGMNALEQAPPLLAVAGWMAASRAEQLAAWKAAAGLGSGPSARVPTFARAGSSCHNPLLFAALMSAPHYAWKKAHNSWRRTTARIALARRHRMFL